MKRKKLALFTQNMAGGGAERVMLRLAVGLAERGHDVDLVLATAEGPYMKDIPDSVRVVDLKQPTVMLSLPPYLRYLRQEKPDAVLSALNQPNVIAVLGKRFTGTKTLVTIHNTLSRDVANAKSWHVKIMPFFVKKFFPKADAIISCSSGAADDLSEHFGIDRKSIDVIYNPVIVPKVFDQASEPLDHEWFQPGQPPVVVAVGRLHHQKDFPNLLNAWKHVQDSGISARLLILGEGDERPALEALIEELGIGETAQLHGFTTNPFAFMARCHTFVMSSLWEGLPTVLIEALALGPNLVSTDCPSGPYEILEAGKHGKLVPIQDAKALGDAIIESLHKPRSEPISELWQPYSTTVSTEAYERALVN